MWIEKIPYNIQERISDCYRSNFLWNNDKVYVMDNHLSAAWCWLQRCDKDKDYNFMHIDMHYDMQDFFEDEDLQPLINNPQLPYMEFKNLKRSNDGSTKLGVFRWDNYIVASYVLHPKWFHSNIFLTHKKGDRNCGWGHEIFKMYEDNPSYMDNIISQYVGEPNQSLWLFQNNDHELPWIINLDLDVFYSPNRPYIPLFSDEFIRHIAMLLNKFYKNINILTIALSPSCNGGKDIQEKWKNSFHILKIMSEELESLKSFPFPEL